MPRFSVVIPCYNVASTLPDTLASLRQQSLTDWEAICVDDGSTDETLALLRREAAQDDRIIVWPQQNAGPSCARNTGVALAKANWIAFLDADDEWSSDKLAEMEEMATEADDIDAIYGRIAFYDPQNDRTTAHSSVKEGPTPLARLLGENPVCTLSNLCVRKSSFEEVGGFREDMRFSEDLEFLIRLVSAGKTLVGTRSLLVRYRASIDGLSANLVQMHLGWRQAVLSAGTCLTPPQRARAEAVHLRYLARRALRLDGPAQVALRFALDGFRLSPLAFLGSGHRGPLTLAACLLAPLIPNSVRRRLFA